MGQPASTLANAECVSRLVKENQFVSWRLEAQWDGNTMIFNGPTPEPKNLYRVTASWVRSPPEYLRRKFVSRSSLVRHVFPLAGSLGAIACLSNSLPSHGGGQDSGGIASGGGNPGGGGAQTGEGGGTAAGGRSGTGGSFLTGGSTSQLTGVHPNDQGYAYMANIWYAAIKDFLPN